MISKSISLIVPVYNEAEIVEETVGVFLSDLGKIATDFEIIVVDDGSKDATGQTLTHLSEQHEQVRVLRNAANLGSGRSLWRGMQAASKEVVLTNFADRPFDLADIERVLDPLETSGVDFVVVARKDRSANSFYRKLTSTINYFLIRLLFGVPVRDFQFVQAYKASILRGIELNSTGTFLPPELMIRLIDKGYSYQQIVCQFHKRTGGVAKCGKPSVILTTLREMFRFWIKRCQSRKRD